VEIFSYPQIIEKILPVPLQLGKAQRMLTLKPNRISIQISRSDTF